MIVLDRGPGAHKRRH